MPPDLPDPERPLRIGTRGSPLALAQAHEARDRLMAAHGLPEVAFAIVAIRTTGDRVQDRALSELGGKGLFTREIEAALIEGRIDVAVHSMKDMPTLQPDGLAITALLPREDVRDAFVGAPGATLASLPAGSVLGTSSLRRRAQALHRRPDIAVVEFRGSVETRLRKLADGVAAATFLAMAGLRRLGFDAVPRVPIDPDEMLPAIAQGAIGVEQRRGDDRVSALARADPRRRHRPPPRRRARVPRRARRLLPYADRRPRRARRRPPAPARRDPAPRRLGVPRARARRRRRRRGGARRRGCGGAARAGGTQVLRRLKGQGPSIWRRWGSAQAATSPTAAPARKRTATGESRGPASASMPQIAP